MENCDVLVIGAGPVGCYFAHEMGARGYEVRVIDKLPESELGKRLSVFHCDKEMFAKMGIPEPKPGDDDYLNSFDDGSYYSPYGQYMKRNEKDEKGRPTQCIRYAYYPFLLLSLPAFLVRMRKWCAETGKVTFSYETAFEGFIYENNVINGAKVRSAEGISEVRARLVVDVSGIPSVGRRSLRKPTEVEDFEIGPRDMMYVVLRYAKLLCPERDEPKRAEHWAYYKGWIGEAGKPGCGQAVFGTGANLSYEYAQKCFDRFVSNIEMPPHEIIGKEQGIVPFRRAPYSMVDHGFICLGDSACMNKWIGEGICSSWVGAKMAVQAADAAMKNGAYPFKEKLWAFNVDYNTHQAADFAYIMSTLINAVECSADEMDYEFRKGIVFNDKAMTRLNRNYNADMPIGEVLQLVAKVVGGVLSGNIRVRTVKNLLRGIWYATLLKAHYKKFPKTPAKYAKWAAKADRIWRATGNMADVTEKMEAQLQKELAAGKK